MRKIVSGKISGKICDTKTATKISQKKSGRKESRLLTVPSREVLFLSALIHRELYGLEIIEAIKREAGERISIGSLYTTLHRMEKKGLVTSRWGEATEKRAGNRRRYYKITGLGEKVLKEVQIPLVRLWGLAAEGSLT